jgi:hypothetical protein
MIPLLERHVIYGSNTTFTTEISSMVGKIYPSDFVRMIRLSLVKYVHLVL